MPKRPTLRDHGVDQLFSVLPQPDPPPGTDRDAPGRRPPKPKWEDTHHRRTFHCPDALWARLEAWCARTQTSRSAAISQALEQFLRTQDPLSPQADDGPP